MAEHILEIYQWSGNKIPASIMPHSSLCDLCKYSLAKPNTCELSVKSAERATGSKSIRHNINKVTEHHAVPAAMMQQSTIQSHVWPLNRLYKPLRWPWELNALQLKKTQANRQNTQIKNKNLHQYDDTCAPLRKHAASTENTTKYTNVLLIQNTQPNIQTCGKLHTTGHYPGAPEHVSRSGHVGSTVLLLLPFAVISVNIISVSMSPMLLFHLWRSVYIVTDVGPGDRAGLPLITRLAVYPRLLLSYHMSKCSWARYWTQSVCVNG